MPSSIRSHIFGVFTQGVHSFVYTAPEQEAFRKTITCVPLLGKHLNLHFRHRDLRRNKTFFPVSGLFSFFFLLGVVFGECVSALLFILWPDADGEGRWLP